MAGTQNCGLFHFKTFFCLVWMLRKIILCLLQAELCCRQRPAFCIHVFLWAWPTHETGGTILIPTSITRESIEAVTSSTVRIKKPMAGVSTCPRGTIPIPTSTTSLETIMSSTVRVHKPMAGVSTCSMWDATYTDINNPWKHWNKTSLSLCEYENPWRMSARAACGTIPISTLITRESLETIMSSTVRVQKPMTVVSTCSMQDDTYTDINNPWKPWNNHVFHCTSKETHGGCQHVPHVGQYLYLHQ